MARIKYYNPVTHKWEYADLSFGNRSSAAIFDPTLYGLPVLDLTGDTTGISKENAVSLAYAYGDLSGSCTLKWQGASSINYEKKNYTIKFDNAFEAVAGWGEQTKYCLKANFIDHSHARNIVCAKLWGQLVKNRASVPDALNALPNGGAIDGFPIVIMLNGEFHGLYTFNIPKDGWMFGMGNGEKEAIISMDNPADDTAFYGATALDAEGMELEYATDESDTEWVKISLNTLINACVASTGLDLDTTIAQYIDWESVIDYYLFAVLTNNSDGTTKNYLLATFDGTKWFMSAYDMDAVMGLRWDGKYFFGAHEGTKFVTYKAEHRLMELVYRFKTDALRTRWAQLRSGCLSENRLCRLFENFGCAIPAPVYMEDVKRWPTIPGSSVNNIDQILRWLNQRLKLVDEWVDTLPDQETPVEPDPVPETKGNLVTTSTDTDGSIYNGVGYKDDTRLSSSGGVSSSAQAGTVTTGFMEWISMCVLRIKGAIWPGNDGGHYYINFFDADKALVISLSKDNYTSTTGLTLEYDESTGVTTIDFGNTAVGSNEYSTKIASAAYFRLCAQGEGADLIVTINEEIE